LVIEKEVYGTVTFSIFSTREMIYDIFC